MIKMVKMFSMFLTMFKLGVLGGDGGGGEAGGETGGEPTGDTIDTGGAYDYSGMVTEGGSFSEGWQSGLNEDLRGDKTLAAITDINQMSKMLVHSQKMIGKDTVALLNENSTDEERNEFYTKMGRPESADKYEINTENVSPDFKELVEGDMGWYKDFAFKHGISQDVAQNMFNDFQEHNNSKFAEQMEASKGQADEKFNNLMQTWGNDANANLQQADNLLNIIGMSDDVVNAGLQKNEVVIGLLHKMSQMVAEDTLSTGGEGNMTQNAQEQINAIMEDKNSPYWNGKHPRHREIVNKMQVLYSKLG